jgi:hypothetical protein
MVNKQAGIAKVYPQISFQEKKTFTPAGVYSSDLPFPFFVASKQPKPPFVQ